MITTLGRERVRQALPDKYKDWADKELGKKEVVELTTMLAKEDPDAYIDILQNLQQIGEDTVTTYGRDAALSYAEAAPSKAVQSLNMQLKKLIWSVVNDPKLTEEQKEAKIKDLGYKYTQKASEVVFADQEKRGTALAGQVKSGSRGNKTQLMQLMFGNMMMKDALNRDIPYIHTDPYVFGTSPMSYWVSASSGRKGMYDVQAATGQAGYLGKQVTNVTHDVVIEKDDCGTKDTGVPFKAADPQNIGRVLLRPFHKHQAGEVVDAKMVAEADDDEEMILRTPMTCRCANGVCAKCNGLSESGRFPGVGEYVALNSARAFVEPITQQGISCLHPDTLVRMADWSVKRIADIAIGDMVIGVDIFGRGRPVCVTRTYEHGKMPMYMTKYRRGFKTKQTVYLISTLEHKALQATIKSSCKDAANNHVPRILPVGAKGRHMNMVPLQCMEPRTGVNVPEALFLGLMAGDGCYTAGVRYEPHFSCADPLLIEDTQEYMAGIGLRFSFHKGSQCYWRVSSLDDTHVKGKKSEKNPAKIYLDKAGMRGKYAHEKEFPVGYANWDHASMSAYISGLLITDGSLFRSTDSNEPRISFGSTSEKLTTTLCDMLQCHCGVMSPAIHTTKANDGWHKRTMYCVTYGRKADILKILKFVRLYGVKEDLRKRFMGELLLWKESARQAEIQLEWSRQDRIYVGECDAYDIEVDHPSHLFLLANGLVVSNSKHGSGIGGKKVEDPDGEDQPTGFPAIERMFQAQQEFPGGAVLAPVDGIVTSIRPAAQGGNYITVGSQTLYCNPNRTFKVKVGDKVTAGDVLTNGVPNPAEVVGYKGLGQGRIYYMNKLNEVLKKAGFGIERSNLESYSRAAINKVRITSEDGYRSWLPGDVVNYSDIAADYKPRDNAVKVKPDKAVNKYLESPVLFYSIGTKITPDVAKNLQKYGFNDITVSPDPPPFKSEYMRPAATLQNDKHWLPRMAGERLRDSLFDAARREMTDSYDSTSYVDRIVALPFKQ